MRIPRLASFAIAAGASALFACNKASTDTPFTEGMPESSAYQLEVTGDVQTEGLSVSATDLGSDSLGWRDQALSGQLPEYLRDVKDGVRALNSIVARLLDPVADLIRSHPDAQAGDSALWTGTRGTLALRFGIKKLTATRYAWLLQAKPIGAGDDKYVNVMGGALEKGAEARRGRGGIGIDLDKLASVDPSFHGSGQLLCGFAHVSGYKILNYALHNFSPDTTSFQSVGALFSGVRGPAGGTDVKLAFYGNVDESATPAKELVALHARWLPGVGGRSDVLATAGDVPAGHVIAAFSCYDGNCSDAKGFLWVADCMKGQVGPSCKVLKTAGMPSNCAPGLQDPATPSDDPNAPVPMNAPENPLPPQVMPDGNG